MPNFIKFILYGAIDEFNGKLKGIIVVIRWEYKCACMEGICEWH